MSKSNVDILVRLPLAALAIACGSALGAQINPDLAAAVRRDGSAQALIVLADQSTPMLAPFAATADYKQHRRALVDALRSRAEIQQSDLRALLDSRGHRLSLVLDRQRRARECRFANALTLLAGATRGEQHRAQSEPSGASAAAGHVPAMRRPKSIRSHGASAKINAPEVWAAGDNGQSVVIAGEDTGYQWDHPALKPHYRGWNGTTANHNYNWHDSIHDSVGNPCGNNSPAPCDDFGHGTHTAGTFAGDDGATHQIGVAPGAKWIGCRNMDDGNGTPARYIECMQWMLAPTDLNDQNPNPDLAPDVISNSWTCIPSEGCTAGNEIHRRRRQPDRRAASFSSPRQRMTGPTAARSPIRRRSMRRRSRSARPTAPMRWPAFRAAGRWFRVRDAGSKTVKPDVSAPGVNVPSSWPPNTYANLDGTSMATPHVAGAAALVMSANPALKGHPARRRLDYPSQYGRHRRHHRSGEPVLRRHQPDDLAQQHDRTRSNRRVRRISGRACRRRGDQ